MYVKELLKKYLTWIIEEKNAFINVISKLHHKYLFS